MTITDMTMREQVIQTLGGDVNDYDVSAIVAEIQEDYGTMDVNTVPVTEFWEIVAEHAK